MTPERWKPRKAISCPNCKGRGGWDDVRFVCDVCGGTGRVLDVADARRIEAEGPLPPPPPIPPLPPLVKRILGEFAENEAREYAEGNFKAADLWRRAAAIVELTARR